MNAQVRRKPIHEEGIPLKLVSSQELLQLEKELHNLIAQRAFQLFQHRGGRHGHDVDNWLQAESEILHSCRHNLTEYHDSLLIRGELPGIFAPEQIKVSVEPHRVMVSGEAPISALCSDGKTAEMRSTVRRVFRAHKLPAEVDPSHSKATLKGEQLEINMPKARAKEKSDDRT